MRQMKAVLLSILFNFKTVSVYTFLSGIFISLSANLLTSIAVSDSLKIDSDRISCAAVILFISSASFFVISLLVDNAKSEWESDKQMDYQAKLVYTGEWGLLKFSLLIIALLGLVGAWLLISGGLDS